MSVGCELGTFSKTLRRISDIRRHRCISARNVKERTREAQEKGRLVAQPPDTAPPLVVMVLIVALPPRCSIYHSNGADTGRSRFYLVGWGKLLLHNQTTGNSVILFSCSSTTLDLRFIPTLSPAHHPEESFLYRLRVLFQIYNRCSERITIYDNDSPARRLHP